ncbi:MAG: hypothetical protein IJ300_00455 [Clostridia bacterium]|nr:hypothetical protein [Clostridia bacterium]
MDFSDEECAEALIHALQCGGTLGDLMGDLYDPSPMEITENAVAIKKQMENINTVYRLKKELKVPFLFLANGTHYKLLRVVGPMLGCCMYL